MPHPNGRSPNIITLSLHDESQFIEMAHSHLDQVKFHVRAATTIEEASQLLKTHTTKAIIAAGECQPVIDFFTSVKTHYHSRPDCPVLVYVSATPVFVATADLVIPSAWLEQINQQLEWLIEMRADHVQLDQAYHKLKDENRHLKSQLEYQTNSTDDINFLKNAIVWNVAHELRTPLLQVKTAVALLAEDAGNNTNAVLVDLAMGATTRLESVVKDITLLNELVNESIENRSFEPVLLREVIDSAIRNLRRSWMHKNDVDRIHVKMPANVPPVLGDKQRLAIAIQLLMDNALKFSNEAVEVAVKPLQETVRITVRDKGIGIPKDKIERVFDTFYQVDSSTTKRYGGMGIGLAIVRFILDRHQAVITVETAEDKGSSFSFELRVIDMNE